MKALVLKDYNQFAYQEVPTPTIQDNDVLIKIMASGICGSDVHGVDGSTGRRKPPVIMGHEASGIIVDAGANVHSLQTGDRVTFESTVYCGTCYFCRKGYFNMCDNRRVFGVSCDEYHQDGAMAEYIAVPQQITHLLPEKITFEQAAMVEPVSVAVHAVGRTKHTLNDTALVIGTGMIGLLLVQVLRAAGCGTIIAADIDQRKLDMAISLGVDIALKSDECNVIEEVKKLTDDRGADIAFEVVGITPTITTAIKSVRKGGSVTLVGNLSPEIDFPLQFVGTNEITLYSTYASLGEYPTCLDMIARGSINVNSLISETPNLADGAHWFQTLCDGKSSVLKVLLMPFPED